MFGRTDKNPGAEQSGKPHRNRLQKKNPNLPPLMSLPRQPVSGRVPLNRERQNGLQRHTSNALTDAQPVAVTSNVKRNSSGEKTPLDSLPLHVDLLDANEKESFELDLAIVNGLLQGKTSPMDSKDVVTLLDSASRLGALNRRCKEVLKKDESKRFAPLVKIQLRYDSISAFQNALERAVSEVSEKPPLDEKTPLDTLPLHIDLLDADEKDSFELDLAIVNKLLQGKTSPMDRDDVIQLRKSASRLDALNRRCEEVLDACVFRPGASLVKLQPRYDSISVFRSALERAVSVAIDSEAPVPVKKARTTFTNPETLYGDSRYEARGEVPPSENAPGVSPSKLSEDVTTWLKNTNFEAAPEEKPAWQSANWWDAEYASYPETNPLPADSLITHITESDTPGESSEMETQRMPDSADAADMGTFESVQKHGFKNNDTDTASTFSIDPNDISRSVSPLSDNGVVFPFELIPQFNPTWPPHSRDARTKAQPTVQKSAEPQRQFGRHPLQASAFRSYGKKR